MGAIYDNEATKKKVTCFVVALRVWFLKTIWLQEMMLREFFGLLF